MSARKHTPGPWINSNGTIIPERKQRADAFEQIAEVKFRVRSGGPSAEGESNARLIAAAPELLAALEDLVERVQAEAGEGEECGIDIGEARAAIAKAKGGAS